MHVYTVRIQYGYNQILNICIHIAWQIKNLNARSVGAVGQTNRKPDEKKKEPEWSIYISF